MMNVTEPSRYIVKTSDMNENCSGDASYLFQVLRTYCKGVPAIRLHTGQVLDFGGATVEVLYTVEDIMPESLPNVNDSSLVIRLRTADTSFMILADTCYRSGPILDDMWGDYLKSDIVQVAHHNFYPIDRAYGYANAKIACFPQSEHGCFKNDVMIQNTAAVTKRSKYLYYSGDVTKTVGFALRRKRICEIYRYDRERKAKKLCRAKHLK